MVCKKSVISKIIIILAIVAMVAFCGMQVRASDDYDGELVGYFEYNGQQIPYYCLQSFKRLNYKKDGETISFVVSRPTYFLFVQTSSSRFLQTFSFEEFTAQWTYDISGNMFGAYTVKTTSVADIPLWYGSSTLNTSYEVPFEFHSVNSASGCYNAFMSYMVSELFVPYKPSRLVDWYNARPNTNFYLKNVRGSVQDDVFTATWELPDLMPKAEQFPILLDFTITDLATNEREIYYYPLAPDVYGMPRQSYYDMQDLTLSVDLKDLVGLPTDYRVDFVALTPYYEWVGEHSSMAYYYKGQTSSIYLNYTGHYDFTIQVAPDLPVVDVTDEKETEKGILISVQNFFSGFFSNFGNMLKDLFIPSKEQMQSLFADMESFFGDRLGFLWFPFDLAITIVDTFTYGTADSVITVPPINLNILGGIDLYGGGQFDMDAVGIFPYVRMVSSIVLACSVATLAYKKWDEWIGGHDS